MERFSDMRMQRLIARTLISGCGLWRLHGTRVPRFVRSILDEIDLQHLRSTNSCPSLPDREQMYAYIHEHFIKSEAIDYLEFGVYRGESISTWASLNGHRDSRFFGFDSFEGLPETWRQGQTKGHFAVEGRPPVIDDSRVTFIKGWFDQTAPVFFRTFTRMNRLVLHMDADLYSSTMVALNYAAPFLQGGCMLIFDEFYDREHEFSAFRDFLRIFGKSYHVVCQTDNYGKICVELL